MITIILGTRPEIIKFSSILHSLQEQKIPFSIIHTNQHYDTELDSIFFDELKLPKPDYRINSEYTTSAQQIGTMIIKLEEILLKTKTDMILVQGDTNSAQAGAIVASKLKIKLGHVEAGLRSYDDRMPEEFNRIVCDHLSTINFAPTKIQEQILLKEGIESKKIFVVGNTIKDVVSDFEHKLTDAPLEEHNLEKHKFILLTLHRPENVDNKQELEKIFNGLEKISEEHKLQIIFPIHPRTKKHITNWNLTMPKCIKAINPTGYFDFLALEKNASAIVTDSGGVQEEACILRTPCITTRISTERPETVDVGANAIAGTDPDCIHNCFNMMMNKKIDWTDPFGDGYAGETIVEICKKFINKQNNKT